MKLTLFHFISFILSYHKPSNSDNCNGCSLVKSRETFKPPSLFQWFEICQDIVFLHLTFANCVVRYTLD